MRASSANGHPGFRKAKVTFEADEKAKFDDVQKTMDALSTAGVKFRMAAKE